MNLRSPFGVQFFKLSIDFKGFYVLIPRTKLTNKQKMGQLAHFRMRELREEF
jgi:hypothetical protein